MAGAAPPLADAAFLDLLVDTARQRLRAPPPGVPLTKDLEAAVADVTGTLRKVLLGVRDATSFLLVGPPGGGKALVLERVLTALATPALCRPTPTTPPQVAVVRLSGGHAGDDRATLREVTAQLGLAAAAVSVDAADVAGGVEAAAHAAAAAAAGGGGAWSVLAAMDTHLRVLSAAATGVLFVLEEFDTYAAAAAGDGATSLLYTLLNVVGSGGVRAAVLGTTAHVAPTDGLEKRVRSRFAHRQLVLKGGGVEEILAYMGRALTLPPALAAPTTVAVVGAWNADVAAFCAHPATKVAVERYLRRAAAPGPLFAAACRTAGSVGVAASHLDPALFAAEVRREWSGGDPDGPPGEATTRDWHPATDGLTRMRVAGLPPAEAGLLLVARKLARDAAAAAAAAAGTPAEADAGGPGGAVGRSAILRTYHRLHATGGGGRGGGVLLEEVDRRGASPLGAEAMDAALQRLVDADVLVEVGAEEVGDGEGEDGEGGGEAGGALALAVDPAVVDVELRRHDGVPTVVAQWGASWLE